MKGKVTIDQVERALDDLALLITHYGDGALPVYVRLEKDLAEMKAQQAVADRIRLRVKANHPEPATPA